MDLLSQATDDTYALKSIELERVLTREGIMECLIETTFANEFVNRYSLWMKIVLEILWKILLSMVEIIFLSEKQVKITGRRLRWRFKWLHQFVNICTKVYRSSINICRISTMQFSPSKSHISISTCPQKSQVFINIHINTTLESLQ